MLWRFRSLTVQHGDETLQGETRISIGPEVHRDIAWWQHKLGCDGPEEEEDLQKVDKNFIAPIARCIDIAPTHEWHSDASYEYGIGWVCMATGLLELCPKRGTEVTVSERESAKGQLGKTAHQ